MGKRKRVEYFCFQLYSFFTVIPNILRKVPLQIVSMEECAGVTGHPMTGRKLCAGKRENATFGDTCRVSSCFSVRKPKFGGDLSSYQEFYKTCHSVTFYFMKKDSKRGCDTTTPESIHTKDESKRGSAFAFIFCVN